ncbi:neither inactivation nor afterpotential protein C isoform X3 [Nilaparvata lugens]|uniref:neither inactivation nor afterpotential protein C isoform X3 n=1 Tax=Nilaparvata lugens TaxID=108931 RepID=UPI00193DF12B|nr:neither inactivation nor afterpotential protein C isoform X3 [Nilaparvata lugens]
MPSMSLEGLRDPGDRYELGDVLGSGVYGTVYAATDSQSGDKKVAIKVQGYNSDTKQDLEEEYNILSELATHPNFPDFYGAYKKQNSSGDEIWFVMQLCEGGSITDLVRGLQKQNKRMTEEHIAYILKETVKALVHLHEHNIIHRDVRGSNILVTHNGEIKLIDFGLSRNAKNSEGRRGTSVGSPSWMAPEVVTAAKSDSSYDSRIDVWSLGITAIELGDGKAPFEDIHPTRALFQIVRNPPPLLYRPANWTQIYNDFIAECLEKNPENRPFMVEILEHPFLTNLPENDYHLTCEIKSLISCITPEIVSTRKPERQIRKGLLQDRGEEPKILRVEDLAALDGITEDSILVELEERSKTGKDYTFVGDVLMYLNPNEERNIYDPEMQTKYQFKSRSDNAPHIFCVADSAYQDMLHHDEPQHIVLAGETMSGKTTQCKHLVKHLLYLGLSPNKVGEKIEQAIKTIHAFGNAATAFNPDSTRHIVQTQITYSSSGKVSGAIFWLYQLDKWRITGNRTQQKATFHIFYYFYDYLVANNLLDKYKLEPGRKYNFLHTLGNDDSEIKSAEGPRENTADNVDKFKEIKSYLEKMEFDEAHIETIFRSLAAILLLGEVRFQDHEDGKADIKNPEISSKAAELLRLDEKKFNWALCNYCVILKGQAVRRKHTKNEAEEARNVLAAGIYYRLFDWLVNVINLKLSFSRAVFGDKYYTTVLDLFGFECYQKNGLEQLFVNTMNEQLQYFFNQRVFVSEMQEQEEEDISLAPLQYYDNKPTVDELMMKPDGLMYMVDEASRSPLGSEFIIETLTNKPKGPRVKMSTTKDFCVAHYTGKVMYETNRMAEKNRDFLPPEMIETMRLSSDMVIKQLFTNQLTKSGNLTFSSDQTVSVTSGRKKRWGAALVAESDHGRKFNTESKGEYSQTRRMRTAAATFRASSLEVLRSLGMGPEQGSIHFVRCLRSNLTGAPRHFQAEVVRQQLRALAIVDTARARQKGYSCRISFPDFIRRYKFLAFDFDENVDVSRDNCRLLLVRLKMEGWTIGKTKVFLKYYNEEYLSRLYETQVKKIVKVQCMMRAFLAKRNFATKLKKFKSQDSTATEPIDKEAANKNRKPARKKEDMSQDEAAVIIQSLSNKMDTATRQFMKQFCKKWKSSSIFQVLLLYRATKYQELVYFSQQAHLYNGNAVSAMISSNKDHIPIKNIDQRVKASQFLGEFRPAIRKIPFRINEFPFCDTHLDPSNRVPMGDDISWDDPFKYQAPSDYYAYVMKKNEKKKIYVREEDNKDVINFIQTPYCRDPDIAESVYQGQPYRRYDTGKRKRSIKSNRAPVPQGSSYQAANVNVRQQAANFRDLHPEKTFAPPPPSAYSNNNNYASNRGASAGNKFSDDSRMKAGPGVKRDHNPIIEMELRGKRQQSDGDDDNPPFNFQAMLRKTNVTRASLRRSPEPEDAYNRNTSHAQYGSNTNNNAFEGKNLRNTGYNSNVVYNSNAGQKQSGWNSSEDKFQKSEYNRSQSSHMQNKKFLHGTIDEDSACEGPYGRQRKSKVKTELLPGIVMEGEVAEL